MCRNVHSGIICSGEKLEVTSGSLSRRMYTSNADVLELIAKGTGNKLKMHTVMC